MGTYHSTSRSKVPSDLFDKVMQRIDAEQQFRLARQRFIASALSLVTVLAFSIPVWRSFQLNLSQSGFADYLSLGFYDWRTVAGMWQDFTLSLLESLPIVSTVELLVLVFGLLFSLKRVAEYSRTLFTSTQFIVPTA